MFYLVRVLGSCFTRRTYRHALLMGTLSRHAYASLRRTGLLKIGVPVGTPSPAGLMRVCQNRRSLAVSGLCGCSLEQPYRDNTLIVTMVGMLPGALLSQEKFNM